MTALPKLDDQWAWVTTAEHVSDVREFLMSKLDTVLVRAACDELDQPVDEQIATVRRVAASLSRRAAALGLEPAETVQSGDML